MAIFNVSNFLVSNDGLWIDNPRYYEKTEKKLDYLHHKLSRKGCHKIHVSKYLRSNYQSLRKRLAKISKHVKNQGFNFLEQLSAKLIETQDFLVGKNLKSKNILRNHSIAKNISSVSWREFIGMLEQKAQQYYRIYILVSLAYTTQRCSKCGYIMQGCFKLDLGDRILQCPNLWGIPCS